MQVDKITLQDIGLFDNEEHTGLASHLNFCKSLYVLISILLYLHSMKLLHKKREINPSL
jgi:hypothetical protein